MCLFVHGFEPYFYVEAPQTGICNEELDSLQKLLNVSTQFQPSRKV